MLNGKHGGNDLSLDIQHDFSANLSPLGMSESVRKAAADAVAFSDVYPDSLCRELRKKLSGKYGILADDIVCGNGADDLIYRTVSALKPKSALIVSPAFSEYKKALSENGCKVDEYILSEENEFEVTEEIVSHISGYDMVFLCTPNNPTGRVIAPDILSKIFRECEKNSAFLFCDESYIGFTDRAAELSALNCMNDKTIILSSFTKLYAMAGLRLGYVVCGDKSIADRIAFTGQYWSVSAPAQAAGIAAIDEEEYVRKAAELVKNERAYLQKELHILGIKNYPSDANFILFRADKNLGERMLREKILLRCCEDYSGLDGSFYRIAVKKHEENEILISVLRRCING